MKTHARGGANALPLANSETTPLLPLITMPSVGYLLCLCYPSNEPQSITFLSYVNLHKTVIKKFV